MKVAILAGGYGTRISEETDLRPKPMIQIGGKPILWHIMKHYAFYGHNDFVILLGYKGYYIKEYFANYFLHQSDVTIDISTHEKNSSSSKNQTGSVSKSSQVLVRKREDVEKSVRINEEKAQEHKPDTWYKHWEKDDNDPDGTAVGAPKRLGGNKRVKPFRYADKDEDDSQ